MLQQLVVQIAPDLDPADLQVTRDSSMWYKIVNGRLFVPAVPVLKANVLELGKFVEAVKAFASTGDGYSTLYEWDNLQLYSLETAAEIAALHTELRGRTVAVDIETRRVEWEDNRLLAIGFAYDYNHCAAIDWDIIRGNTCARQAVQQLLSDESITFVWHNGKFDCTRLKYLEGLDARVDEDTMLMHYACINERRGTHGLKDLGPLYLQAPQWDDELQEIRKSWARKHGVPLKQFTYDLLPKDILIPYMQRDCIATLRLLEMFTVLRNEGTDFIYRKLIEASNVFKELELNGFAIDLDYMEDLEKILEDELIAATCVLSAAVAEMWDPIQYVREGYAKTQPKEFNLKSPKQLKWFLEKLTGLKLQSTDAATIDALSGDNPEHEEVLDALKRIRTLNKQIDTYICGLRDRVCRDMRIRGTFNLHGTETGRLSSSDPNMQNIPRQGPIKGLFVAAPGKTLLQLDYSQAEVRGLAYLSGDEHLIRSYQDGRDIHSETALGVFGPNYTKEDRNACKNVIFGSIYGRGPASVAEQLKYTMAEARGLINRILNQMPKAKVWIAERRAMATAGDDCISVFGRRRHFVLTGREALNHVQNEYINTPIQSLASDLTLFSLLEIYKWIRATGFDARIISTVHDSIVLEVYPDDLDIIADKCIQIMADTPKQYLTDCIVPFKADAEYGERWGELQAWEAKQS